MGGPYHHPPSLFFIIFLSSLPSLLRSQQPYEGVYTTDCNNQHNSSSLLGYFCNGRSRSRSCQAYLTFHSQPPYQSVSTISALLGSDPSQISQSNAVSKDATFPTNTKVVVPVNCSCSGGYYQSNSTYLLQTGDTALSTANNTYQGLSTCQALQAQAQNKSSGSGYLIAGTRITVPLRCACPTSNQSITGVKYLLSYLVDSGDTVFLISNMFGVTVQSIMNANDLSSINPTINPFTTLLIPLQNPPNSSQITTPPPPPPPPTSAPTTEESSNHTGVYVGIGVAVGALVLISCLAIFYVYIKAKAKAKDKRNKAKQSISTDDSDMYGKTDGKSSVLLGDSELIEYIASRVSEIGHAFKVYRYQELQLATENFSNECKIAGSVYRGVFNGDVAAVKMMNRDVAKEIEILKRISHFNLITLSGFCVDQGRWFLVYEYAENGSLSDWVFDTSGTMVLSWIQRVQIALDVANGLNYLHGYTKPACVHMDVSSSNVLLDGKFRAKIANFGLARPAQDKEGQFVLTRHIVGTRGYMAPEYLEHGLVSPKLDIYSLGVVMMEIISGKNLAGAGAGAGAQGRRGDQPSLEDLVAVVSEEDAAEKLRGFIDPLLEESYPKDLALTMARLIEGCLRRDAGSRPSTEEISQSLSIIYAASLSWAASNTSETEPLAKQRTQSM